MVDVFEEVDELVRSDHYTALLRRVLPWVIGIVVIGLVGAFGAWGYLRYQENAAHKASVAYSHGVEALTHADFEGAYKAFGEAAKEPAPGYKTLALMQQAGVRVDQKRMAEAVVLYDQAAKVSTNPTLSDAAALKAALTLMDEGKYDEVKTRLKPLSDAKRPYSALAREALAMTELATGDTKAARSDFVVLSLRADAPDDVRQRARLLMAVIDGGGPSNLAQIVAKARTTPPPTQTAADMQAAAAAAAAGQAPTSQTPPAGAAQ